MTTLSSYDPQATSRRASEVAKHWIDGEWIGSDTVSESIDPASGKVLGRWADPRRAEPSCTWHSYRRYPTRLAFRSSRRTVASTGTFRVSPVVLEMGRAAPGGGVPVSRAPE